MCTKKRAVTGFAAISWEFSRGKQLGIEGKGAQTILYFEEGCVMCARMQTARFYGWVEGEAINSNNYKSDDILD